MVESMSPTQSQKADANNPELDSLVLHLWRLLDWRFLLPHPQPTSVGYGGDLTKELKHALTLLDPECFQITADSPLDRQAEVIFLRAPEAGLARAGVAAVQPGGWVCIQHQRSLLKIRGPRTLMGWKRCLKTSGFQDVSVYWVAPTLALPSRVVPVASRTAVVDTLRRHEGIRWGSAKAVIGRIAFELGLFAIAVPEGVITARRHQEDEGF